MSKLFVQQLHIRTMRVLLIHIRWDDKKKTCHTYAVTEGDICCVYICDIAIRRWPSTPWSIHEPLELCLTISAFMLRMNIKCTKDTVERLHHGSLYDEMHCITKNSLRTGCVVTVVGPELCNNATFITKSFECPNHLVVTACDCVLVSDATSVITSSECTVLTDGNVTSNLLVKRLVCAIARQLCHVTMKLGDKGNVCSDVSVRIKITPI